MLQDQFCQQVGTSRRVEDQESPNGLRRPPGMMRDLAVAGDEIDGLMAGLLCRPTPRQPARPG